MFVGSGSDREFKARRSSIIVVLFVTHSIILYVNAYCMIRSCAICYVTVFICTDLWKNSLRLRQVPVWK